MADQSTNRAVRKPYVKPKVTQVRLNVVEAVLSVCKNGAANTVLCGGPCTSDTAGS